MSNLALKKLVHWVYIVIMLIMVHVWFAQIVLTIVLAQSQLTLQQLISMSYFASECIIVFVIRINFICLSHQANNAYLLIININKLDSKKNLPLLSKATRKKSTNKNQQFLYTGMLQYPLLITWPKASDYLYNKEEIDMNSNLVTE